MSTESSASADVSEQERKQVCLTLRRAMREGEIECSRDPNLSSGPVSLYKSLARKGDQSKESRESFVRPKDAEADKDPKWLRDSSLYSFYMSSPTTSLDPRLKEIIDFPKADSIPGRVSMAGSVGDSAGSLEPSASSTIHHPGTTQRRDDAFQLRKPSTYSVNDYSASEYSTNRSAPHSSPTNSIHTKPTSLSSNSATADLPSPPGWTRGGFQSPLFDGSFLLRGGCDDECASPFTLESEALWKSTQSTVRVTDIDDLPMLQPTVYSGYFHKI
jgi:hypothetical protein